MSNNKGSKKDRVLSNKKTKRNKKSSTRNIIIISAAVVVLALVFFAGRFTGKGESDSLVGAFPEIDFSKGGNGGVEIEAVNGSVRIPVNLFDGPEARYFSTNVDGRKVNYFALRSSDGVVRAAFDACDVCYGSRLGYRQEGDLMICNNCGQQFVSTRINEVRGGCNPSPLDRSVEGEYLVIDVDALRTGLYLF